MSNIIRLIKCNPIYMHTLESLGYSACVKQATIYVRKECKRHRVKMTNNYIKAMATLLVKGVHY